MYSFASGGFNRLKMNIFDCFYLDRKFTIHFKQYYNMTITDR